MVYTGGLALDADGAAAAARDSTRVLDAVATWADGATYLNFAERPFDTSTVFTPQAWARLQELRRTYDPRGVLRTAHPGVAGYGDVPTDVAT